MIVSGMHWVTRRGWTWLTGRSNLIRSGRRGRERYRPTLEVLEDRTVPALIWSSSGIAEGTTSIIESANVTQFSYDVNLGDPGPGVSFRTATFSAIAEADGLLPFAWNYSGFHGFFANVQTFEVFADGPQGRATQTLVLDFTEDVPFEFSDDSVIEVNAGFTFGFTIGGGNFDSNSHIAGTLTISVPTISGAPTVLAGQTYTLDLSYPLADFGEASEEITSWTINWGDGPAEVFVGNPSSVTHVYADAPNAYLITATAYSSIRGDVPAANDLLLDVLIPVVASADSTVLTGAGATSVTTPDGTATATLFRTSTNDTDPPLVVFLAHYGQDPHLGSDPNLSQVGAFTVVNGPDGQRIEIASFDLRDSGAVPGDVVVVSFKIPQGAILPILNYIDEFGRPRPIVGLNGTPTIVNGAFVVIFDFFNSRPTLSQLTGTVFTITDVAGFVPPLVNLIVDGQSQSRNLAANSDVLGALLGGDDDDGDGGALVAAVATTQVSTFSQGGSGSDPTEEENRARQRELLGTVETILQQFQQILGMQLYQLSAFLGTAEGESLSYSVPVAGSGEFAVAPDAPVTGDAALQARSASEGVTPTTELEPDGQSVSIDPFAGASAAPLSWSQLFNRQLLSCMALAALPFLPWLDLFATPEPERRRSPSLK